MCDNKTCAACQVEKTVKQLCDLRKGDVIEMSFRRGRIENISGTLIIVPNHRKIHDKRIPFTFRRRHYIAYKKPRTDLLLVSVVPD